jgi:hypothetical protein
MAARSVAAAPVTGRTVRVSLSPRTRVGSVVVGTTPAIVLVVTSVVAPSIVLLVVDGVDVDVVDGVVVEVVEVAVVDVVDGVVVEVVEVVDVVVVLVVVDVVEVDVVDVDVVEVLAVVVVWHLDCVGSGPSAFVKLAGSMHAVAVSPGPRSAAFTGTSTPNRSSAPTMIALTPAAVSHFVDESAAWVSMVSPHAVSAPPSSPLRMSGANSARLDLDGTEAR